MLTQVEFQQNDSQNHHLSPEVQWQNSPCHGVCHEADTLAEIMYTGYCGSFKIHTNLTEKSWSSFELSDLLRVLYGWITQHWIQHSRKWNFIVIIEDLLKIREMEEGTKPRTCPCNTIIRVPSSVPWIYHSCQTSLQYSPRHACILGCSPGKQVPGLKPGLLDNGAQSTSSTSYIFHPVYKL